MRSFWIILLPFVVGCPSAQQIDHHTNRLAMVAQDFRCTAEEFRTIRSSVNTLTENRDFNTESHTAYGVVWDIGRAIANRCPERVLRACELGTNATLLPYREHETLGRHRDLGITLAREYERIGNASRFRSSFVGVNHALFNRQTDCFIRATE